MPEQLLQKCYSYQAVIHTASQLQNGNNDVYASAKTVVDLANASKLSHHDVVQLALHLGMKVFPRHLTYRNHLGSSKAVVAGLPNTWIPFLDDHNFSLAYRNPEDRHESIIVVPSAPGHLPYIIHQTSESFVHPDWFNKIVPILHAISIKPHASKQIAKTLKNEPLTLGQLNTINHFFKQDPILKIEGVCTKCYQVNLPKKGFGVRYSLRKQPTEPLPTGVISEIRYSARKPGTNPKPYVTEFLYSDGKLPAENRNGQVKETKNRKSEK